MRNIILLFILLMPFALFGQSKKEVLRYGIITQTIYEVDYENSNGQEVTHQYEKYDENGNMIEYIEYDDRGKPEKHERYEYNANNQKTKEIKLDNGKIYKVHEYNYNAQGLKTERKTYDSKHRLLKVKRYEYTYREE